MRPRIGISACLLGERVRYDGGHKRDAFLTDTLAPHVEYVRVCPEVEVGMGTPRETLQLVRDAGGRVRMVTTGTRVDYTGAMERWAAGRLDTLAPLDGYVLKKSSPSCGWREVPVDDENGTQRDGRGLFAAALAERFPGLAIVEERDLLDAERRPDWVQRVFLEADLRRLFAGPWDTGDLVAFHTAYKMQILAHSPVEYAALGRVVAGAARQPREEVMTAYASTIRRALAIPPTRARHTNVLLHLAGHVKARLDAEAKKAITEGIERYRLGHAPRSEPLDLLRAAAERHAIDTLRAYRYLYPPVPIE